MFLKQIKIIGFKSFVEPTVIEFRSNRIAIVGPNGCGKSNIIDAIRWVMGESSPKFLRGDLMADVIFNGSMHRKPMGLASVEITLDNAQNLLQGAYVKKGDVSLRREVNRSGESSYYINQQRVRRKDLSDLWLGTGAGARGYAIIGQNMVNQLVEANPEALKAYLEEAAGVSKYKERRKESATRLALIHENIARILDIVSELATQLERLSREASDAKQYHVFKQSLKEQASLLQYAKYKAILKKITQLDERQAQESKNKHELNALMAIQDAKLKEFDGLIEDQQEHVKIGEQELYKLQMDLSQQEHLYVKQQQDKSRYAEEKQTLLQEILLLEQDKREQIAALEDLKHKLVIAQARQEELNQQIKIESLNHNEQEAILKKQQTKKHDLRLGLQKIETQIQVLHVKLEQAQQNINHYKDEMQNARSNHHENEISAIEQEIAVLSLKIDEASRQKKSTIAECHALKTQAEIDSRSLSDTQFSLKELEKQYQDLRKDLLSAEASYEGLLASMQHASFETGREQLKQWLETWHVPFIWQGVVDFLWQHFLPHGFTEVLDTGFPAGTYIAKLKHLEAEDSESLLQHFGVRAAPSGFFNWTSVKLASTTEDALKLRQCIAIHESVLTPDGLWLGVDWQYQLSFEQKGLASRLLACKTLQAAFNALEQSYEFAEQTFLSQQKQHQMLVLNLQELDAKRVNIATTLDSLQQKHTHLAQKKEFFKQEQIKKNQAMQLLEARYIEASLLLKNNLLTSDELAARQKQIEVQLDETMTVIQLQKTISDKSMASGQLLKQEFESIVQDLFKTNTKIDLIQQELPKIDKRMVNAEGRLAQVDTTLLALNRDDVWSPKQIEDGKNRLYDKEARLSIARQTLKDAQIQKQHQQVSFDALKKQDMLLLETKWRHHAEKEQLEHERQALEQGLVMIKDESPWLQLKSHEDELYFKKKIMASEQALLALGDVNLLALGLYEEERLRHDALLAQLQDLQNAMKELEEAIQTLDHDMQLRLEITLKSINEHLLEIFPQLFGGGQAKFIASCDNLLDATVSVHVQLPGKKQHRIQLLSGGEKALTAVALLFSIFSLNPAPFCLLDEVDAALDDANVLRLSSLVKKLSEKVQFVLITHNPLTMDAADDLVGVTMQEPGVSRVVSVNMAMALEMVNKE